MKLRLIQQRFDEVLKDLIVGLKDGSIVLERDMGEIQPGRRHQGPRLETTTTPSGSPTLFYVWANSVEKAIIELHRGRYFESAVSAYRKKPTGMRLWSISFDQLGETL